MSNDFLLDAILYINLDHRTDRNQQILSEIEKIKCVTKQNFLNVHRISAINQPFCGHIGCGQSHVKALEFARNENYSRVLILEDDFKFIQDMNIVMKCFQSAHDHINDWDLIMLAICNDSLKDTDCLELKRVITGTTTSGYLISSNFYQTLIDCFNNAINNMIKEYKTRMLKYEKMYDTSNAIDQLWSSVFSSRFLVFNPVLGYQNGGYSDIMYTPNQLNIKKDIYTNTPYLYGIDDKVQEIVFTKPHENVRLTNDLCRCDPVPEKCKYLYDYESKSNQKIKLFTENDYITIKEPSLNCVSINPMGGLGNILFILANGYAYSKKHNIQLCLSHHPSNPHTNKVYDFLKLIPINTQNSGMTLQEDNFSIFKNFPRYENVHFHGYFQNEKYFIEYKADLYNLFQLYKIPDMSFGTVGQKTCFIHVRRGDYVNHPYHYIDLNNYYKQAIKYVTDLYKDCVFLIFSDDIDYCKTQFKESELNCSFVEGLDELQSLKLMTLCQYGGICPNSTFSWWGVYLNTSADKLMIFPNKWLNSNEPIDIYPTGSVILKIS